MSSAPSADPVEDTPYQLTFSGNSDGSLRLYAVIKPAGGQPCGPTRDADNGGTSVITGRNINGAYSETLNFTSDEPGDYLVCAWVQTGSGATSANAANARTVTVRTPRATGAFQVPAEVQAGSEFQVAFSAQNEVERRLYVDLNAPGVPCGANYDANQAVLTILNGQNNQGGPTTYTRNVTAPKPSGQYTLCGWVQEGSGDTTPEASFNTQFQVTYSDACLSALRGSERAATAAARHGRLYRKYKKLARRSKGSKRRRYTSKAKQEKRRQRASNNSVANWNDRIGNECA